MTDNAPAKRRPDYVAYAVKSKGANEGPAYTRIGVGFSLKNGGVSVLYDGFPLRGQIVLIGIDDEEPGTISYGSPLRKADFDACMVREGSNDKSFWTEIGSAYRQDGYISIHLEIIPAGNKVILSVPRENS